MYNEIEGKVKMPRDQFEQHIINVQNENAGHMGDPMDDEEYQEKEKPLIDVVV